MPPWARVAAGRVRQPRRRRQPLPRPAARVTRSALPAPALQYPSPPVKSATPADRRDRVMTYRRQRTAPPRADDRHARDYHRRCPAVPRASSAVSRRSTVMTPSPAHAPLAVVAPTHRGMSRQPRTHRTGQAAADIDVPVNRRARTARVFIHAPRRVSLTTTWQSLRAYYYFAAGVRAFTVRCRYRASWMSKGNRAGPSRHEIDTVADKSVPEDNPDQYGTHASVDVRCGHSPPRRRADGRFCAEAAQSGAVTAHSVPQAAIPRHRDVGTISSSARRDKQRMPRPLASRRCAVSPQFHRTSIALSGFVGVA